MREVLAEFLTTDPSSPKTYGDSGCMLGALSAYPMVLRHEHYSNEAQHILYLFAREPELGAQVFIRIFPLPRGNAEYKRELEFYIQQKKDFRFPSVQPFEASFLAPASCRGFRGHTAFRTRDGKYRRRIVHGFEGVNRSVLLVLSLDNANFFASQFFSHVSRHLKLSDTVFEGI